MKLRVVHCAYCSTDLAVGDTWDLMFCDFTCADAYADV